MLCSARRLNLMAPEFNIRNPKRYKHSKNYRSVLYEYYAGYSADFVYDAIKCADLPKGSTILDPWNGSGTTTKIANELGYIAYGYDINPAMLVISKARQLDAGVKNSLQSINKDILSKAKRKRKFQCSNQDPLHAWFDISTLSTIRGIEQAIRKLLVEKDILDAEADFFSNVSDLASFFYVSLFNTVRQLITPFLASNPTWIKIAKDESELLHWEPSQIYNIYINVFNEMLSKFNMNCRYTEVEKKNNAIIGVANSNALPLNNCSISAAISSPPYCTRIDYAISTRPELAVLGFSEQNIDALRREMIGTPKISKKLPDVNKHWGTTCLDFLSKVAEHDSKAAKSYYYKHYVQYFNGINQSILELNRVLKENGVCVLVLQDSYFKDVHNDLPRIFIEMGEIVNWKINNRIEFTSNLSMANINRKTKQYRSKISTTETVLVFQK